MKQQPVIGHWVFDGFFPVDKFNSLKSVTWLPSLFGSFLGDVYTYNQPLKPLQWKTEEFGDLWSKHESLASCYWEINIELASVCWHRSNSWMVTGRLFFFFGKEMTSVKHEVLFHKARSWSEASLKVWPWSAIKFKKPIHQFHHWSVT